MTIWSLMSVSHRMYLQRHWCEAFIICSGCTRARLSSKSTDKIQPWAIHPPTQIFPIRSPVKSTFLLFVYCTCLVIVIYIICKTWNAYIYSYTVVVQYSLQDVLCSSSSSTQLNHIAMQLKTNEINHHPSAPLPHPPSFSLFTVAIGCCSANSLLFHCPRTPWPKRAALGALPSYPKAPSSARQSLWSAVPA